MLTLLLLSYRKNNILPVLKLNFTDVEKEELQEIVDHINSRPRGPNPNVPQEKYSNVTDWIREMILASSIRGASLYRQYKKTGKIIINDMGGSNEFTNLQLKEIKKTLVDKSEGKPIAIHIGESTIILLMRSATVQDAINNKVKAKRFDTVIEYAKEVMTRNIDIMIQEVWKKTADQENEDVDIEENKKMLESVDKEKNKVTKK